MINSINNNITGLTAFGKVISKVAYGSKIVGELIRSCFGSGYGVNNRSGINSDGGKN